MKKKFLVSPVLLAALFLFAACTPSSPAPEPEVPDEREPYKVRFYSEGKTAATPQTVLAGDTAIRPKDPKKLGYTFDAWYNGDTKWDFNEEPVTSDVTLNAQFNVEYSDLPAIFIHTENGKAITSKDEYTGCTVSIENTTEEFTLSEATGKIKGRGNSTWGMPKKPYKLKFDKKVDLFGNGKAKTWVLLANYSDSSLLRNDLALSVGALFETQPYTSSSQHVDLYLNGRYDGVYELCEQVQADKNRVDISEELGEVDMDYLIEMDYRAYNDPECTLGYNFFRVGRDQYVIKSPDSEDKAYTSKYCTFAENYITRCYEAMQGDSWEKITRLIDVASFAESYVINEVFKTVDIADSSFYMYKRAGGKIYCGPMWDYDLSTGNCNYKANYVPRSLYAVTNIWFYYLLQHGEFVALVRESIAAKKEDMKRVVNERVDSAVAMRASFERNFERWDILGKEIWPHPMELVQIQSWRGHAEYVRKWVLESIDYLDEYYCGNKP